MLCLLFVVQGSGQESPSASARVKLAITALMHHYDTSRGLWNTEGWWNAANTATVLGNATAAHPSAEYLFTLQNTFTNAQKVHPLFRNEYYDDEGWWALAWIQAYDVTHRRQYLQMAESIFDDMSGGWDDTCGGGIWWKKDRHYKNAIANELFLSVGAHLANREHGKKRVTYLSWAKREWSWFDNSGMINQDNLVNDGLTPECRNNGRNTWTYNQGVLIGGLAELSAATRDPAPTGKAQQIAHAAIRKLTDSNLVLHDLTEPKCSADTVQFKGIFVRNLVALQRAAPSDEYLTFVRSNADSIWNHARVPDNEFSCSWSGPPQADGAAASTSALDALIAADVLQ
ncbi:MAG: glycoside hydrolase family 76 protein [Granulicella sp.]